MRILYGVAGEGMGHATRSHAFLADLVGDHEVLVVASGRAHDYLAQHFPEVREILGFSLAYEDNAIRRWETVTQNLRGAVSRWPAQIRSFYEVARDFAGRRGGQRLRGVRAHRRAPRARAGDQRGQHHDARPLPARRGHHRRRHARLRAGAADRPHQGSRPALGGRADVLPPAAAAPEHDAGGAGAAGGGARRPAPSGASTCSSTRRRPAARPWSGRCTRPGCPAGCTACAAT